MLIASSQLLLVYIGLQNGLFTWGVFYYKFVFVTHVLIDDIMNAVS
jgi:hypothetical protein